MNATVAPRHALRVVRAAEHRLQREYAMATPAGWRAHSHELVQKVLNLGPGGAARYALQRWRQRVLPRGALVTLTAKFAKHRLQGRAHTSDLAVFRQVFARRAYACLDDVQPPSLIVDCGAYVGYSGAYFLTRFPTCHLIAIEPDPQNYALLKTNLAPYGRRVTAHHAAVWSHEVDLRISRDPYRDGREWTRQVTECRDGDRADFSGIVLGRVLAESGHRRIGILKVDIEGAEAVVFGESSTTWIDRVDTIAIELHDDSAFGGASDIFARAIAGRGFSVSRSSELTVCRRAT